MTALAFGVVFGTSPIVVLALLAGGRWRERRAQHRVAREMDVLTLEARIKGWI